MTISARDPYRSDLTSFNPRTAKRLESFLQKCRSGAIVDPKAAFDFDGTVCKDDIAESFLQWSIDHRTLRDVDYGHDIMREYHDKYKRDPREGLAMAATVYQGLEVGQVHQWAEDFARSYVPGHAFPMQVKLIAAMQECGVDVRVVSASPQFLVAAAAPHLGVPRDHAIGIRTAVEDGKMTAQVLPPLTYRAGKVEALRQHLDKAVDFAAGNAMTDYEMLQSAGDLALVINPASVGPNSLFEKARGNHWAIQRWDSNVCKIAS